MDRVRNYERLSGLLRPFIEGGRHGQKLAEVLEMLGQFTDDCFEWFDDGFSSGRLARSEMFPPEYVFDQINDIAQNDITMIQRVSITDGMPPELLRIVQFSEFWGRAVLGAAERAGWLQGRSMIFCYFDDDIQTRTAPYAHSCMISIPYAALWNPLHFLTISHEIGHFVHDHGRVDGVGIDEILGDAFQLLPAEMVVWAEEAFCDAFSMSVSGPMSAIQFQELMRSDPDIEPNRIGGFIGWASDNGQHIPSVMRPLAWAKMMALRGDAFAVEVFDRWLEIVDGRGGWPEFISSISNGNCIDIPVTEYTTLSLGLDMEKPLDVMLEYMVRFTDELSIPDMWLPYIESSETLADLELAYAEYVEGALSDFAPPDYAGAELTTKTFDELLPGWVDDGVLQDSEWLEVLHAGGWTKSRQHSERRKTKMALTTEEMQQIVAMVVAQPPALGMQPPALGMQPPYISKKPASAGLDPARLARIVAQAVAEVFD